MTFYFDKYNQPSLNYPHISMVEICSIQNRRVEPYPHIN